MKFYKWNPFNYIKRLFEDQYPDIELENKPWDLRLDLYDKDNNNMAEMDLNEINTENINLLIENKICKISEIKNKDEEIEKFSLERFINASQKIRKIILQAEINLN